MRERDSQTVSLWQQTAFAQNAGSNQLEGTYDVLIVGAGITGITTALLLQRAGKRCVIAEAKSPGFGTTGGTTAHLNTIFDTTYPDIEKDFGADAAKLVAEAGRETIDIIRDLVKTFQIDCDFQYKDGFLYSETEDETKELAEILSYSRKAGVDAVEAQDNHIPIPFQLVVRYPNQAQFHPLKYIDELLSAFVKLGGVVLTNTLIEDTKHVSGVHVASSEQGEIRALNLVYATHIPPGLNIFDVRCAPYRSYVMGVRLKNDRYPDALVYDMQEPYHYFRTHESPGDGKLLIVGGEDHKTGHDDPEEAFKCLEAYVRKYYEVEEVAYRWSAQYYTSGDGLPYIGEMPGGPKGQYLATGYEGNGMTFGSLAGKILSDLILQRESKYADLFSPSRIKPLAGTTDVIKENLDVAYRFFADRLSVDELKAVEDLQPGEGKVVKYQGKKMAVYKDNSGNVKALNPTCTHAKCIVDFNPSERSWDCPCHGGRFDLEGRVITGPPRVDLEKIDLSNDVL